MARLFGIKLIALFYFAAGGGVGTLMHLLAKGNSGQMEEIEPAVVAMALLNFILIPCWQWLLNKRHKEKDLSMASEEMKAKSLFLEGLPTNQRIALAIWGAAWAAGFLLSVTGVIS